MAIALVQNTPKASTTGANPTITAGSAPTSGNLLVVMLFANTALSNITDPAGWTRRASKDRTGTPSVIIIEKQSAGAGDQTVTFTCSSVSYEMEFTEWSGAASVNEFDQADPGGTNTASFSGQPGSITPVYADELLIGVAGSSTVSAGEAVDSGFTVLDAATLTRMIPVYKIKTDAAAENPTISWTTSRTYSMVMAAFRSRASLTVSPGGVATGAAFGTTALSGTITPSGITTGQAIGSAKLQETVTPSGIAGAGAFGVANLQAAVIILPSGIVTGQTIGTSKIMPVLKAQFIASFEAFGSTHVLSDIFSVPGGKALGTLISLLTSGTMSVGAASGAAGASQSVGTTAESKTSGTNAGTKTSGALV